jgi:hypothetical protein
MNNSDELNMATLLNLSFRDGERAQRQEYARDNDADWSKLGKFLAGLHEPIFYDSLQLYSLTRRVRLTLTSSGLRMYPKHLK